MKSNFLTWKHENSVKLASQMLLQGGIVLAPSDTIPGFFASITAESLKKLDHLKGRREKPYLVLVPFVKDVVMYISYFTPEIERLTQLCWPGPVTIIFSARKELPSYLKSEGNTIALRVPDHRELQQVLQRVGPLFSTSANYAGEPTVCTVAEVNQELQNKCDFILYDAPEREAHAQKASTILKIENDMTVKVIRRGAYPLEVLMAAGYSVI